MSEIRDLELGPEERRARDMMRALPRVAPRPAFRARLKREFASGELAVVVSPRRVSARPPLLVWSWAPAAAALLVVLSGWWLDRSRGWSVASPAHAGVAMIDGRPVALGDRAAIAGALRHGGAVRLPADASLELVAPGSMAVEIVAGSDATIPPVAGRWFGRRLEAQVRSGEIRVTTGRDFHGARLAVRTPEASVMVVGTTLAVIRDSVGTCVCVMEGRVMMGPRGAPMAPIEAGRRRFVFNDGRPPEEAEMRPTEKIELGAMHARHADMR